MGGPTLFKDYSSMLLLLKCVHDGVDLLRPLEGSDEVAFLVVKGQVGKIADLIKRGEEEFFVPAYLDIRVFEDAVVRIELFHFFKRLISGHHDLDVLEFVPLGQDGFRLVFAMVAIGAEEHDDRTAIFFQILFCYIGRAVELQQAEGRKGGVTLIRCEDRLRGLGRLNGRGLCLLG